MYQKPHSSGLTLWSSIYILYISSQSLEIGYKPDIKHINIKYNHPKNINIYHWLLTKIFNHIYKQGVCSDSWKSPLISLINTHYSMAIAVLYTTHRLSCFFSVNMLVRYITIRAMHIRWQNVDNHLRCYRQVISWATSHYYTESS